MNKAGKDPTLVQHTGSLELEVADMESQGKLQVLYQGVVSYNVNMTPDELMQNCLTAINFLASLLEKPWNNLEASDAFGKASAWKRECSMRIPRNSLTGMLTAQGG